MKNFIIINDTIITETEIKDLSDLFSDTDRLIKELDMKRPMDSIDKVIYCLGSYIVIYERSSFLRWLYPEHAIIKKDCNHQILQFGFDNYASKFYLSEFCIDNFSDKRIILYDGDILKSILSDAIKSIYEKYFKEQMSFDKYFSDGVHEPIWFRFAYADANLNKDSDLSDRIYLKDCYNAKED